MLYCYLKTSLSWVSAQVSAFYMMETFSLQRKFSVNLACVPSGVQTSAFVKNSIKEIPRWFLFFKRQWLWRMFTTHSVFQVLWRLRHFWENIHSKPRRASESPGRAAERTAYAEGWQAEGDFGERMKFHKPSSAANPFANSWFQLLRPTKKDRKKRWKEEI